MKKLLLAVLACVAISSASSAAAQEAWDRTHETCDVLGPNGALCVGLAAYYRLDEAADYVRFSQAGGALMECPGIDISTTATTQFGQVRTATFDGSNSKGFLVPGGGTFGGGTWTVAVWVYPTSNTVDSTILSTEDANSGKEGLFIGLDYNGTDFQAYMETYLQDTDAKISVRTTTAITPNAWHLLVFRSGSSTSRKVFGSDGISISRDDNAFTTIGASQQFSRPIRVNSGGNLVIGKSDAGTDTLTGQCSATGNGFTGHMQALGIWNRALSKADVDLLWNSGNGRDFPFIN
jgi:opacity protein-like surface antigen